VLYHVLGPNIRMVAKKELFALPVFGRALREGGFISVDRDNRQSAIKSLDSARLHLEGGTHIWIAPEGTRSPTGELMPFKKGGFMIALATGAPILPITVRGTRDILRAKGMRSRRGVEVTVTIHEPIDVSRFRGGEKKQQRDELIEEVRRVIGSAL
jgi:1-acyl-sn-glycerol-3-phosphate acyltransferase